MPVGSRKKFSGKDLSRKKEILFRKQCKLNDKTSWQSSNHLDILQRRTIDCVYHALAICIKAKALLNQTGLRQAKLVFGNYNKTRSESCIRRLKNNMGPKAVNRPLIDRQLCKPNTKFVGEITLMRQTYTDRNTLQNLRVDHAVSVIFVVIHTCT